MPHDMIVVKVDRARALLAEASNAQEAKMVADMAKAAEVYARRQKLGEESIRYATAIMTDAMTLLGEFLKAVPPNTGAAGNAGPGRGKRGSKVEPRFDAPPTLAEVGIDKKVSSNAKALADLKTDAPDLHEDVRNGKTTIPKARVEKKRREKRKQLQARADAAPEPTDDAWRIIHGDALVELRRVTARPRLIFADPPYNIGIDYGDGVDADRMADDDYLKWCRRWMAECSRLVTIDGSFWVLICWEYAGKFESLLEEVGFTIRSHITWFESFGVNCANNFNRCSRRLFWCVKNPKQFVFNPDPVTRPSDRQTKYGDKRADPGGKIWDDIWGINPPIPRLVGTAEERITDLPTQLPIKLLEPIVLCASEPGDLVLDSFSGSATTGVVAITHGRRYLGIERQPNFAEASRMRLATAGNQRRAATGEGLGEEEMTTLPFERPQAHPQGRG